MGLAFDLGERVQDAGPCGMGYGNGERQGGILAPLAALFLVFLSYT